MRTIERLVKYKDGDLHMGRILGLIYLTGMLIGIGWYYLR